MPNEYKCTPLGRIELTDQEQANLDASRIKTLEVRKEEIEEKTQELLSQGLEYPANSGIFHSLEDTKLPRYNAARMRQDGLKYPRRFKGTKGDIISLSTKQAHDNFDNALTSRYAEIIDGELDLLEAIYNANSQSELDAIVDNR